MKILVLNAGSSSQKCSLYEMSETLPVNPPEPIWEAEIDWVGSQGHAEMHIKSHGQEVHQSLPHRPRPEVLRAMLTATWSGPTRVVERSEDIRLVGHRVVHGGPDYRESAPVTNAMRAAIEKYKIFAPSHNPANLQGMEVVEAILPRATQIAVFDTAFHRHLPDYATVYAGPYAWYEEGIRRYGFHGINHQYCLQRAATLLGREAKSLRLITCHLGNGCSLAAIRDGWSVDTTMGFTPLEGLMMGSRSGSLDPGILLYLLQRGSYTPEQLDEVLNKQSGLKGISGQSSDMRAILQARSTGNERAALAFDLYVHRLRECLGSMLAVLGGLDALVFSGGVGEHSPEIREAACATLGFCGVTLDRQKNAHSGPDQDIATQDAAVRILVIQAQEDWMIACECLRLAGEVNK